MRGVDNVSIKDHWADGVRTHLGVSVAGFPNFFMLSGPQSPFANIPAVLDRSASFIGHILSRARAQDAQRIESTEEAVKAWGEQCQALLDAAPPIKAGLTVSSWFVGANIPGKKPSVLFYFGGAAAYFAELDKVAERNFEGFSIGT
jgi:cyclohexanone monooxygenase